MTNSKKIFFVLFFFIFCFLFWGSFVLALETEQIYPQVPGAELPGQTRPFLPGYIKYVFNFALIISGIIAFLSIVYGGIRYLASMGNPTTLSDARSQIAAGIFGLFLLITAYLILIQINPQLTILTISTPEFEKGVILYKGDVIECRRRGLDTGRGLDTEGLKEGEDYLMVKNNLSDLQDFNDKARSIYFFDASTELEVKIFSRTNYEPVGSPSWYSKDDAPEPFLEGACFSLPSQSKSIQLIWKMPGIYLFADAECSEDPHFFTTNISDFGGLTGFDDKAKSIKIIPRTETKTECDSSRGGCEFLNPSGGCYPGRLGSDGRPYLEVCRKKTTRVLEKFGAILHEHNTFRGDAEVFFGRDISDDVSDQLAWCWELGDKERPCSNRLSTSACIQTVGEERTSSLSIFHQRPPIDPLTGRVDSPSGRVTLYEHTNYNGDEEGDTCDFADIPNARFIGRSDPPPGCNLLGSGNPVRWAPQNSKVSSITIEGDYVAVLFRGDGTGEVFRGNVPRLKEHPIGNDQASFLLVIPVIKRGGF